jgi:histidyl-tRNA synthetase
MSDAVEPRIFRGLRDYLPDQMRLRNRLIDTVRGVYESYGFLPLGTPAVEYLEVLLGPGGHEANEQIFRVRNPDRPKAETTAGEEAERLGLRFDLTVPLARVISQHPNDLALPFRRYQVASVWRADKPDRGRYREFTQFDIDAVGVESELADAEIIAAMCDTMTALDAGGLGGFKVRFSSRKILNLLLAYAGVPAKLAVRRGDAVEMRPGADVFRVLDKLPKIGLEKVRLELTRGYTDESGDKVPGLGLEPAQVQRIEAFLNVRSDTRLGTIGQLRELFAGVENAEAELARVKTISDTLAAQGYDESRAIIDLSIARGLAYYTGPVFETTLDELPQFGSVMSGGRYDDLIRRFKGVSVPAVGTSIGIDRLLAALVEGKKVKLKGATAQVLVTTMDASLQGEYLALATQLRRAGVRTEIYLGSARVGKQMKYADALGIPLVLLVGSDEQARGVVQIKQMDLGLQLSASMATREEYRQARPGQFEVARGKIVESVKDLLAGLGA